MNNGTTYPKGFKRDLSIMAGVTSPAVSQALRKEGAHKSARIEACIEPLRSAMKMFGKRLNEDQLKRLGARIRKEQLREQSRNVGRV